MLILNNKEDFLKSRFLSGVLQVHFPVSDSNACSHNWLGLLNSFGIFLYK